MHQLIASIRTYARSALPIGELFMVPMESTQSFVDNFPPLCHGSPLGITVLIHFNYAPL